MKQWIKRGICCGVSLVLCTMLAACGQEAAASGQQEAETNSPSSKTEMLEAAASAEPVTTTEPTPVLEVEPTEKPAAEEETASAEEKMEEAAQSVVEDAPSATPTPAPASTPAPTKTPEPTPTATPEPVATEIPQGSPKDIARSYIGQSPEGLTERIGEPVSTEYASSCIGDGEDGIWYYEGFSVYTYRSKNGSERVEDVF